MMLEQRRTPIEDIAVWFDVPLHRVVGPDELPPGYWRRQEAHQIARRRLAVRVRRALRRWVR